MKLFDKPLQYPQYNRMVKYFDSRFQKAKFHEDQESEDGQLYVWDYEVNGKRYHQIYNRRTKGIELKEVG